MEAKKEKEFHRKNAGDVIKNWFKEEDLSSNITLMVQATFLFYLYLVLCFNLRVKIPYLSFDFFSSFLISISIFYLAQRRKTKNISQFLKNAYTTPKSLKNIYIEIILLVVTSITIFYLVQFSPLFLSAAIFNLTLTYYLKLYKPLRYNWNLRRMTIFVSSNILFVCFTSYILFGYFFQYSNILSYSIIFIALTILIEKHNIRKQHSFEKNIEAKIEYEDFKKEADKEYLEFSNNEEFKNNEKHNLQKCESNLVSKADLYFTVDEITAACEDFSTQDTLQSKNHYFSMDDINKTFAKVVQNKKDRDNTSLQELVSNGRGIYCDICSLYKENIIKTNNLPSSTDVTETLLNLDLLNTLTLPKKIIIGKYQYQALLNYLLNTRLSVVQFNETSRFSAGELLGCEIVFDNTEEIRFI